MKTVLALLLLATSPLLAQSTPLHAKVKLSCVAVLDADAQVGKITIRKGTVVNLSEGSTYEVAEVRAREIVLLSSTMKLKVWADEVTTFRPEPKSTIIQTPTKSAVEALVARPAPTPSGIDLTTTRPLPKPALSPEAQQLAEQNRLLRQKFNDDVETLRNLQLQRPDLYGPVQRYYPAY